MSRRSFRRQTLAITHRALWAGVWSMCAGDPKGFVRSVESSLDESLVAFGDLATQAAGAMVARRMVRSGFKLP